MPRVQLHELSQYTSDVELQKAAAQFKNFCTIRRDLRNADKICAYVIKIQDSLKVSSINLGEIADSLFLVRASVMHAILLYARWFKATTGKTMLNSKWFFLPGSKEMKIHEKIIEHRDRYIAHNELDLLGEDRIWVNTDDAGKFMSVDSDWLDQQWLQDNELNMKDFQECIHILHNKIDAEFIPERHKKLQKRLSSVLK